MVRIVFALLLSLFVASASIAADRFGSDHIRAAVTKLRIGGIDTLKAGNILIVVDGRAVTLRKLPDGVVDHIGLPLFSGVLRAKQPSPIYDFLEFACLDKVFGVTGNRLLYKDVVFDKGNWDLMAKLGDSADCLVSSRENHSYCVTWRLGGKDVVSVRLPLRYDVLSISSRGELESRFIAGLRRSRAVLGGKCGIVADTASLEPVSDGGRVIYMRRGGSYIDSRITNTTFYARRDSDSFVPLADGGFPVQSMGNMLVMPSCREIGDAKLSVRIVRSDRKVETVETTVRGLVDYVVSQGCKPYYGVEQEKDGKLSMSLFLYNAALGYDHVLHLECQAADVASGRLVVSARGYLFSPTTNVKKRK